MTNTAPVNEPQKMNDNHPGLLALWKKKIATAVLLILLVAIATGIAASKHTNNAAPTASNSTTATPYKYKTLVDSKLAGTLTSVDFKRPKEFIPITKDNTIFKSEYSHSGPNGSGQLAVIGAMSVYATHSIIAEHPPIDLMAARQALNSGSGYQTYLQSLGINDFLSSELAHRYFGDVKASQVSLSVDKPKVLTTSNIKDNAWLFSFSAKESAQTSPDVSGNLVFTLGKSTAVYNGYNYIMISTLSHNWQPNQQIWQQIIDSIKITDK